MANIEARWMSLFKEKSRRRMRPKMMLLEASMATRKLHLILERSRVIRLIRMSAGNEILPTNLPRPLAS